MDMSWHVASHDLNILNSKYEGLFCPFHQWNWNGFKQLLVVSA